MNRELWVEVEDAYSEVVALPSNARTAFLDMAYGERPEVRREVETLLQYQEAARWLNQSSVLMAAAEMFADEDSDLIGQVIADKYRIRERLGSGGMAEVYLADHIALEMPFALKRPRPALRIDPEFRRQFLDEARRAVILKHENVARVHDVIEAGDDMFVVMEFIEGDTLARRIEELGRPFTIDEFIPIAVQCGLALVAAHEKRIVHLDVKPANIMLTPAGQVKMCDFGVARRLSTDTSRTTTTTALYNSGGVLAGTPAYMAPEVILGETFDERADLFSLGTVFYEMLTGENPFQADTAVATTGKVVSHHPPPISATRKDFDPRLERIVTRMMAKDPAVRYATAVDLVKDLNTLRRARNRFQDMCQGAREAFTESKWLKVAVAAVLMILIATPPTFFYYGEHLEKWLGIVRLPDEKMVMVFDFQVEGEKLSKAYADGLADVVTGRLKTLPGLDVISTPEVAESGIKEPREAFRRLGANLALTGKLRQIGSNVEIVLTLKDGKNGKLLVEKRVTSPFDSFEIQNRIIQAAVGLLMLQPTPVQQAGLGVLGTESRSAHLLYVTGKGYLSTRKLEDTETAIGHFQEALVQDSDFTLAYAGLGNAFLAKFSLQPSRDKRLLDRAVSNCDDAIRRDPNLAAGHICLGAAHGQRGDYAASLAEYEVAKDLDPNDLDIYRGLGRAYAKRNNPETAESYFRAAIRRNPDYWYNYIFLADFFLNSVSRYPEAFDTYQLAIDRAPDNPVPYYGLCGAHITLGRYDEAIKACSTSVSLRPTTRGYINLGVAYFDLRQYSSAAQQFELASKLNPEYYKPVGHLARAKHWMGNLAEARELYLKAISMADTELAINSQNADVHAMVAQYHAMLGPDHSSLAFSHLNIALQKNPLYPEYQCIAAVVYNQFGKRTAALRFLENAIESGYSRTEIEAVRELDNLREDTKIRALLTEGQTAGRR